MVRHGASWQRCRVRFVRNALALVPKAAQQLGAATSRTVFAQPEPALAQQPWRTVAAGFRTRSARRAALLDAAESEVLADLGFPPAHWRHIGSSAPLERPHREGKRRTAGVGSFPNEAAMRRVGMILAEHHDEWQGAARRQCRVLRSSLTGSMTTACDSRGVSTRAGSATGTSSNSTSWPCTAPTARRPASRSLSRWSATAAGLASEVVSATKCCAPSAYVWTRLNIGCSTVGHLRGWRTSTRQASHIHLPASTRADCAPSPYVVSSLVRIVRAPIRPPGAYTERRMVREDAG